MAAVAGTFDIHPQSARTWLLTYVLPGRHHGRAGPDDPRAGLECARNTESPPQTGPPVTVVAPVITEPCTSQPIALA